MSDAKIIFEQTNGQPKITVIGVNGSSCMDLTSEIEDKLGKVVANEKTNEFYEEVEKNTQIA